MAKFRNTSFVERANDSPIEKWGIGATSEQRIVDLIDGSYKSRLQAAYDFLGYAVVVPVTALGVMPGPPINYIHRVIPISYPARAASDILPAAPGDLPPGILPPGLSNRIYALGISKTEPITVPTGPDLAATVIPAGQLVSNYQRVRLTVECTTLPYFIVDDNTLMANGGVYNGVPDEGAALAINWLKSRYIQRQKQSFSRIVKIPYGIMQTTAVGADGGPKLNKTAIPFREGGSHITYTWMRVPLENQVVGGPSGANFGRIGSTLGTINNATFDTSPAQTLLLDSYSTREYQGVFGEWLADISFHMIYLPHTTTGNSGLWPVITPPFQTGWNTVLDVNKDRELDYYAATTAGGTDPPFQESDFAALFRP